MGYAIGRLFQVGIAKETTRGTTPGSVGYWLAFAEASIDEKYNNAVDTEVYGVVEDSASMTRTKNWSEGDIKGPIGDLHFGLFLYSLLGGYAVGTHSGESVVYDHTFTVQEGVQHQSLSTYIHDPAAAAQDYSYANAMVAKLDLEYSLGKFVAYTVHLMAQKGVQQSQYSPSQSAENRFVPQYMTAAFAPSLAGAAGTLTATGTAATTIHVTGLSINTNLLRVGMTVTGTNIPVGAKIVTIVSSTAFDLSIASTGTVSSMTFGPAAIKLKSLKLSVDQNVESYDVLGSLAPADFFNKEFKVEGQLDALFQNESDFKTLSLANTPQAMSIDLLNTDVTIGTSTHPELKILLAKCYFTEYGRPIKIKDLIVQSVKFKAVYSISDASMMKAVLTNTLSTY